MNERLNFNNDPVGEVVAEITVIQQEVATMGANDSEHLVLEALKDSLRTNKISPKDALTQALLIRGSKQDYH